MSKVQPVIYNSNLNSCSYFVAIFIVVTVTFGSTSVFPYPSNVTLTPEQLTEVNKDPKPIAVGCNQKIGLKEDAGVLCDAFMSHISEKCERFDNIFDYCTIPIGVTNYKTSRSAQLACIKDPPSFNDTIRITACDTFIALNSTYHNLPPSFSIDSINIEYTNSSAAKTTTEIELHNIGLSPITIIGASYNIFHGGNKLVSGGIGLTPENFIRCADCTGTEIESLSSHPFINEQKVLEKDNSSSLPYSVNGSYYYRNFDGSVHTKQFSLEYPYDKIGIKYYSGNSVSPSNPDSTISPPLIGRCPNGYHRSPTGGCEPSRGS